MTWTLTITKIKSDKDNLTFSDTITSDNLINLMSQFVLMLAKIDYLRNKKLESDLAIAKLSLEKNNIDDDHIPF